MSKFCCPPEILTILRRFHDGIQTRVQNDRELSDKLCIVPTTLSMMLSVMLTDEGADELLYADDVDNRECQLRENICKYLHFSKTFLDEPLDVHLWNL